MSEQEHSPIRMVAAAAIQQVGPPNVPKKKHKKRTASNGRLKKLWRRAATTQSKGITSRKEWIELQELHTDWKSRQQQQQSSTLNNVDDPMMGSMPGPSVSLKSGPLSRDFTTIDNWQTTEGSDHRDIIMNLLFRQSCSDGGGDGTRKKKRKLGGTYASAPIQSSLITNVPPLPSWSNVCNLSGIDGLAVIEISIEGCDLVSCPLMPSERIKELSDAKTSSWTSLLANSNGSINNSDSTVQRSITACKVTLFQGNNPLCMSDVLMFLPPSVAQSEHGTRKRCNEAELIDAIFDLRLTSKQMCAEGYPFITGEVGSSNEESKESAKRKICAYKKSNIFDESTDGALDLVTAVAVNVAFEDADVFDDSKNNNFDGHTEFEHYVKTFSRKDASRRIPKVFSLDCEMVRTMSGMELARISVIELVGASDKGSGDAGEEENSSVVLDELVKPRRDILDYLTQYSGITPKMLLNVKTRIESIQLYLLSLIHEDDIIVGHSLENDLRALRLVHSNVVDTSIIFRGDNGRKYSLKHLSNVLLQKQIQLNSSSGHCSKEDAEACLILALRRAKLGSSFRLKEAANAQNVLEVFQRTKGGMVYDADGNFGSVETSFAERNNRSCVCIGPNDWLKGQSGHGSQHLLSCESILSSMAMAVPSWLASKKPSRAGLLWAKLVCEGSRGGFKDDLKKLDEIIDSLVTNVPNDIPILVFFQRNFNLTLGLTRQRKAATNPKATCGWSDAQEEKWKRYISGCRNCEALWIGSIRQHSEK